MFSTCEASKVVRGPENMIFKERWREVGLFSPEKVKEGEIFLLCVGRCKARLLLEVPDNGVGGNGHKVI